MIFNNKHKAQKKANQLSQKTNTPHYVVPHQNAFTISTREDKPQPLTSSNHDISPILAMLGLLSHSRLRIR